MSKLIQGVLVGLVVLLVVSVIADFRKFMKNRRGSSECVLIVKSNRTYFRMPSGKLRRIADYAMDLTPGSADMNMFSNLADRAYQEHENEKRGQKLAAAENMKELAKELNK